MSICLTEHFFLFSLSSFLCLYYCWKSLLQNSLVMNGLIESNTVVLKSPESDYFWSVLTVVPGLGAFTGRCSFCGQWDSCGTAGLDAEACWYGTIPRASSWCRGCSQYVPGLYAVCLLTEQEFSNRRHGAIVRVVEGDGRGSLAEQQRKLSWAAGESIVSFTAWLK